MAAALVEPSVGLQWQSLSSAVSSGEKGLQLIYSLFDPIRPMSTFVSTALGNVCVCVSMCICVFMYWRKIEGIKEREEGEVGG